jgi:hypothetical protein
MLIGPQFTRNLLATVAIWAIFNGVAGASRISVPNFAAATLRAHAYDVNNRNQVVGVTFSASPSVEGNGFTLVQTAMRWEAGMVQSEVLAIAEQAVSIDDSGTTVLSSGALGSMLLYPDGTSRSYGADGVGFGSISSTGGFLAASRSRDSHSVATLGTPEGFVDAALPWAVEDSSLDVVNSHGNAIGTVREQGKLTQFALFNGQFSKVQVDNRPVRAIDISDSNTILGYTDVAAVRIPMEGGNVEQLLPLREAGSRLVITSINATNTVTGFEFREDGWSTPLLWQPHESLPVDLSEFLYGEGSPLVNAGRTQFVDINDHGVILGIGTYASTGIDGPFLLFVPEPTTSAVFLLFGGMLSRRRRERGMRLR